MQEEKLKLDSVDERCDEMAERVGLHSDLNNCYASIECMLHPELKGKYIAVCGSTEDRHGIVLAKNQLAKKCGVKTGEVIWQAKQKCPQLTIVAPHMDQYLKFSKIVREIYKRYSPEVEAFGIDESWIELTGSPLLHTKTPVEIANEIRETVKSEVGLTVSVGVSFNKIFAKLGSDLKKPDAVTEITEESFRDQIWPLPASELLYVGRATDAKLQNYGIHTIGDLACADLSFIQRMLGKNGEKLWIYANGKDTSRVMPCDYAVPIKSVGHGITCTEDLLSVHEVKRVLMELSQQVGYKLRKDGLAATRVRVAVRDNKLSYWEYQGKLPFPTQSYTEIADAGYELFRKKHTWNNDIRSLTISAIELVPDDTPIQLDLWTDFSKHQRRLVLEETVEDIRRRFGLTAINFAALASGLKIPGNREIEYKMPSVMYQ